MFLIRDHERRDPCHGEAAQQAARQDRMEGPGKALKSCEERSSSLELCTMSGGRFQKKKSF